MNLVQHILMIILLVYTADGFTYELKSNFDNKNSFEAPSSFSKKQVSTALLDILNVVKHEYIYPEKIVHVEKAFGNISDITLQRYINNQPLFIQEISMLLRKATNDGHINLLVNDQLLTIGADAEYQHQLKKSNFGFEHVQLLDGSIGYIKLNHFFQHKQAEQLVDKAFDMLAQSKALILDIREASEGSMEFAHYLMSYFFESNTLLSNMQFQRQEKIYEVKSVDRLAHDKFKRKFPVYILTSAFVTSAAEYFSYSMQQFNKAVIIGEPTMGIALWSQEFKVNEEIAIKLPVAIPTHPLTQSNWQSIGVIPDYDVDSASAYKLAIQLASAQ